MFLDRTPIDEDEEEDDVEEQFADFKSASSSSTDFTGFRIEGPDADGFVFEKVKKVVKSPEEYEKSKNTPSIPPPNRRSAVDDFDMLKSSPTGRHKPKMSKFASFDSAIPPPLRSLGKFAKPPTASATSTAVTNEFSDFQQGGDARPAFQNSPKKSVSVTDFTAFQSGKNATPASSSAASGPQPGFADFSQFKHSASESDLMGMAPGQDDKYAALRSLTTVESSTSQPEFGVGLSATPEELDDDDFEDFQQATVPPAPTINRVIVDDDDYHGALGGLIQSDPDPEPLEDSFAEFQQAGPVVPVDLFGSLSATAPSTLESNMDLFSKPVATSNMMGNIGGLKPMVGGSTILPMNPQPWLDNIPLDREPPPDDDFGDFQTTDEPMKTNPDSLSVGKSDDSGSLNDFKKASASDLYGMEFDAFGSTADDDGSRPALNLDDLGTPDEPPPMEPDPETLFNSHTSGKLPKVNNIASVDFTTLDLDLGSSNRGGKEDRSDSFGAFNSAPVMTSMDLNNQSEYSSVL